MSAIWQLEHRLADAWPALADERLGQWRLRAAGGFTGRANSALTAGDPGVPASDALRVVHAFATRHGITPTAHVVIGSELERELSVHGWTVNHAHPAGAESAVLVGALGAGSPDGTDVRERPPDGWWELALGRADPSAAQRHVLAGGGRIGFGVHRVDGVAVGAVRGAVINDTLHVARLAVRAH